MHTLRIFYCHESEASEKAFSLAFPNPPINPPHDLINSPLHLLPKHRAVEPLIQAIDQISRAGDAEDCNDEIAKGRQQTSEAGK